MTPFAILTYHSVDATGSVISMAPERLESHMASLAAAAIRGIPLAEAVRHRQTHGAWPERAVAITFDDGYRNNHQHALPVLARHGFRATVFLVTAAIGGRNDWETPPPRLGSQPILSWAEVRELHAAGWEMGGHTHTHPDLRRLDEGAIARELTTCRDAIADHVGVAPPTMAYPYGYTSPRAVAAAGRYHQAAVTTVLSRATAEAMHVLPRIEMYYFRDEPRLDRLVDGRMDRALRVRRWARRFRAWLKPASR